MANPTPPSNTIAGSTTLQAIRDKTRRLARVPSVAQMSDAELDNYINTFVVYDFPEQLRTFNLRAPFSFWTNIGQDTYNTDIASFSGATNNVLYNFQNKYITVHPPVYIAGYQTFFTQSQEQFFALYPKTNSLSDLLTTGNGTSGPFTGTINSLQQIVTPGLTQQIGLLQGNVTFSANGNNAGVIVSMAMADVPLVDPATGTKRTVGNLYNVYDGTYAAALATPPTVVTAGNTINYITGQYTVTFPFATIAGQPISSQTVPMPLSLPQALMYYNNTFTVRPVPDKAYKITFDVYSRPTALINANQSPELEEYWQYIAFGAAKKVCEDRLDYETIQTFMPSFKEYENLLMRRSLVQYSNERTFTLYAQQTDGMGGGFRSGFGWGNF